MLVGQPRRTAVRWASWYLSPRRTFRCGRLGLWSRIPLSFRVSSLALTCLLTSAAVAGQGAPAVAQVPEAAGSPATASPEVARVRSNFVVILTDDQTLAQMRYLPATRSVIGDRGITFTDFVVSYPLCCPSRAALLTGQYM